MEILFNVNNQILTRADSLPVVGDSKNYLTARFVFSAEWSGLTKTAQFTKNKLTYDVLLAADVCLVPWEVLAGSGVISVNVFAGDLITVDGCSFAVQVSGMRAGMTPATATPGIYQQILDTVASERLLAAAAAVTANNAAAAADAAADGADLAASAANAAAASANNAAGAANAATASANNAAGTANAAAGLADAAADAIANQPICIITRSADQAIPTSVYTAISFDAEESDAAAMHDNSTNPTRITVPVAGLYLVSGCIEFAVNATGARTAAIRKNGATVASASAPGTGDIHDKIEVTAVISCAANEYLELFAWQDSGGDLAARLAASYSPKLSAIAIQTGTTLAAIPAAAVPVADAGGLFPAVSPKNTETILANVGSQLAQIGQVVSDTTFNNTALTGTWTADSSTDTLTCSVNHGLTAGMSVSFLAGTGVLPTGISAEPVTYYVESAPTTKTIKLKLLYNGAALDITGDGTPGWTIRKNRLATTQALPATWQELDIITFADLTSAGNGSAYPSVYFNANVRLWCGKTNGNGTTYYIPLDDGFSANKKYNKWVFIVHLKKISATDCEFTVSVFGVASDSTDFSSATGYKTYNGGLSTTALPTEIKPHEPYGSGLGNGTRIIVYKGR